MSPRLLYCRHVGCDGTDLSVAGMLPPTCPVCKQPAKWSLTPPRAPDDPLLDYVLTHNDRRWLHQLRIDPEDAPT